jgi:hypothetical protein
MDFYDSIYQYDLEVQNKIEERINLFIKSINLLKNESIIKHPNIKDSKYKHINNLIDEINTSNKFKQKLILNQKRNLLLRMNNKNKINSKYYIYAKDMNQDNKKMDIIEIENTNNQREFTIESKIEEQPNLELEKCFNQRKINYDKNDEIEKEILKNDENKFNIIKSDINKIVCDLIKQNVKNAYNHKINEIFANNAIGSKTINLNIKNNNYIKIDLPKKDFYFRETKEGKENKKIHNNHSSDKKANLKNFFYDNKKKNLKKELRYSVTNNNPNHLKIKIYKNDILNFNNLNNNNINNLLIINNKVKNTRNDNNMNMNNIHSKRVEMNNKITLKETLNQEKEVEMMNSGRNNNGDKNKNINKNNNDEKSNIKNAEQSHKRMIVRNIQRIQIKNIKLKNNPTGYNLTNICKKKLIDMENPEKNMKKSRPKNRQCASPGDIGLNNKKINILKFKLGKNEPFTGRKNTEKSFKKIKDEENGNNNSIILINENKAKDKYSHPMQFSSIKNKQINDEINEDISNISKSKIDNNNNCIIRNYKANINKNNNIIYNNNIVNNIASNRNSFTKDSENDNYFLVNRNNQMKKSLSKESESHSYLPWNAENTNSIINKSNNKANLADSFLNMIKQTDKKPNPDNKLTNINEYKKIIKNNNNNTNHVYNEVILQNNEIKNGYIYEQKNEDYKTKSKKINEMVNNKNNLKEKRNGGKLGYNDTIYNKEEPISYREGEKIKGRRRILSTKVHIRGVNSSKNFNNIF